MFMSMSNEEKNEKFDVLLGKATQPLVYSTLIMLKKLGRCKFRPSDVEVDEEIQKMLEDEGVLFSKPRVGRGTLIALR